nr:hypothetical protein [Tanacetum cinerariifolium]
MVFVPFTAIDNYRKSVTVGSGFLKKEVAEAYGWLLRAFKKAFVRPPIIVVTDQDGAMRLVVAAEFPESKHRLCIIYDDTDFKDKFGKIVWNMFIGPEEFKDRWNKLMEEINLVNHKWLSKMYRLRSSWVSAFFVDSPLCGLMRTTSSLFIRVQKKIVAWSWLCSITESTSENVEEEINLNQKVTGHYKVLYNKGDGSVSCCCQLFVHSGIVCQHIFCVFKNFKVSCIPNQYILRRWAKDVIPHDLRNEKNSYGEKNEAIEKLAMKASIILDSCVHMLRNNEPKLSVFVNKMKAIKSELDTELPIIPTRTVFDFVQEFIGVKKPDKVKVNNPTGVRPKGREK